MKFYLIVIFVLIGLIVYLGYYLFVKECERFEIHINKLNESSEKHSFETMSIFSENWAVEFEVNNKLLLDDMNITLDLKNNGGDLYIYSSDEDQYLTPIDSDYNGVEVKLKNGDSAKVFSGSVKRFLKSFLKIRVLSGMKLKLDLAISSDKNINTDQKMDKPLIKIIIYSPREMF